MSTPTPAAASDRGVLYQFLVGRGVSPGAAHDVQVFAVGPLRIALVLVIAVVATRLTNRLSKRLIGSLRLVSPLVRATDRGEERARTLTGVLTSLLKAVIWVVAVLTVLADFQIDLAPFVATATVVGAAVGFGAQTLVKDFLSGVLILAEDQYGVGDSITIVASATTGTVESVNLRTTRVRALDGTVFYVPNGDIRTVGNTTESDSVAIVDVVVPPGTDLVAAGRAAEDAARQAAASELGDLVRSPPDYLGVQAEDAAGVTLRLRAATSPGGHFAASRALRQAVLERLRTDGLAWAPDPPPGPPPASTAADGPNS
ncbi:MAG TPA: mechanosensitive ion channel family protein [Acidimicrobiales bacterium]|nr:mechanosensitive ion channel family protein [Acidimicrobiales bacterium]